MIAEGIVIITCYTDIFIAKNIDITGITQIINIRLALVITTFAIANSII